MIKALIVIAAIAGLLANPTTAATQTDSPLPLHKVTRQRPWKISGQGQCGTTVKTAVEQIDGVDVQVKTLRCSDELPLNDIEFYFLRGEGQVFVRTELLALRHLWSYSIDGRVFAYRAAYIIVKLKGDGSREYGGVIIQLDYYDEDGDGTLETRYGDQTKIKLPEWYKNR